MLLRYQYALGWDYRVLQYGSPLDRLHFHSQSKLVHVYQDTLFVKNVIHSQKNLSIIFSVVSTSFLGVPHCVFPRGSKHSENFRLNLCQQNQNGMKFGKQGILFNDKHYTCVILSKLTWRSTPIGVTYVWCTAIPALNHPVYVLASLGGDYRPIINSGTFLNKENSIEI